MKRVFFLSLLFLTSLVCAQTTDSQYLYGIHWYGKTDSISIGQHTDVEDMTGDRGIWVLEITHVDALQAPAWDQPSDYVGHSQKVTQGKGHSLIFRVQPYWSRNVPHSSDSSYTLTTYANDCKFAASTLRDYCHIWQIGNEVNLSSENYHWGGSSYNIEWQPTPAQYAETYIACRDKIHEVTPNTTPSTQIVLMQPVSPGSAIGVRFMDGNEYLWRQIEAVSDKGKIDGFALHSYAEPGGGNYGVDGFWEAIREQLMIIDQLGLGDRPIFITEFNKHMPNQTEAEIGAKFCHRAFAEINTWNSGSGGELPGLSNHKVIAATWFVYPKDFGWDEYALQYWKNKTSAFDEEHDPWKSFNYACGQNYQKGASGGGPTVPNDTLWWQDSFNGSTLDQTPPLPDWKAEITGSGSVVMSGDGSVRLLGNSSLDGGGGIRTAGYVYGNFRLGTNITFTNANRSNTGNTQANLDIRIREGSKGYSFTFYTSQSQVNAGRVILRRTNDWTQIGSCSTQVSGGINNGDSFNINITANGSSITFTAYKNGGTSPAVEWSITDDGQKVGWIRIMTWNLNEARVNDFKLGGAQWGGSTVTDWEAF